MTITRRRADKCHQPHFFILGLDIFNIEVAFAINMAGSEIKRRSRRLRGVKKPLLEFFDYTADYWDNHHAEPGQGGYSGICSVTPSGATIICCDFKPGYFCAGMSTLVHEIVHASQKLYRVRGIEFHDASDEVQAYIVGYLTSEVLRRIL